MAKKRYIIPFFIPHIGCPHNCVFCSQNKITGKDSPVSPGKLLPIIREYIATFPSDAGEVEIAFFGGSFTGIPAPLRDAYLKEANDAKEKGLVNGIRLSTRPDYIDEKILCNLKEFGVDTIELGVQSMDNQVLELSQRGHSIRDVILSSRLIKNFRFNLGLQMMIGLPGSDREIELKTATELCSLKPDFIRIYPALVIRGTYLETMYKDGIYRPLRLQEAVDTCVALAETFAKKRIGIIRMGLQPTDLINKGGEVVAGPFHPSFRQLVDSRLLLRVIRKVIDQRGIGTAKGLTIEVNPRTLSTLQGIGKESIKALRKDYPGMDIVIMQNKDLAETIIGLKSHNNLLAVDFRQVIEKGIN